MQFALWPAFYMTWTVIWWNAGNNDIDQSIKDERQLKFAMSNYYSYCRTDIKCLYRYFSYVVSYAIVPVLITSANYYYNERDGMTNEQGNPYGFYMSAVLSLTPLVLSHYIILIILFNNFDAMFLLMFPIGFSWWLWVPYIDDTLKEVQTY